MIVEMDEPRDAVVPAKLVRRLVLLELAELTVPAPPGNTGRAAPLYFRVLPESAGGIVVELWQVGDHHGSRTVSADGGAQLTARRIALASAELARRLRRRREAEYASAEREARAAKLAAAAPAGSVLHARTALTAGAHAASVGPGDVWLAGPTLSGGLRFSSGARIDVGASLFAGGVTASDTESSARWLELGISPAYAFSLSPGLQLEIGLTGAVAAVHLSDVVRVDGEAFQSDTWSARAAGIVRLEVAIAGGVALSAGPDIGAMLRPIASVDERGQSLRIGGLWAGASVGLVLDPDVGTRPQRNVPP